MDALTIFGAVVGAIDISNKIYQCLDAAISNFKNAPETARGVLGEVEMIRATLESFHHILQNKSTLPAVGPSQLTVGAVSDVMEDCVRTLDTLRDMVKPLAVPNPVQPKLPFSQRFRWAMNERDAVKQLGRLHRVLSCLQSLIIVLTSNAFNDITNAVANLDANLTKVRLDLPSHLSEELPVTHSEPPSPVCRKAAVKAVDWDQQISKAEFEAKLDESGVYRRARGSGYDKSFRSSTNGTLAWSFHGSGRIPSVISVIALPVRKNDLDHPEFYNFSPLDDDNIPSRPVSHLTLSALQARTMSRKSDSIPWSVDDQLQVALPSTSERKSFSADCEALRGNNLVPCMGSLYFDHGLQKWPSPEEIALKLTRCASDGLLDDFKCSHCDMPLASIVISQRPHWTEHSVFCRPCGAQLRVLHGDTFCPCANASSKVYVKYYDLSSSQSLVRCSSCFSCCFSCSRPLRVPTHSRKITPTEHPLRHHVSLRSMDSRAHRRNISASSADSSTSSPFRAPSRLRDRPIHVSLLPSPPISPDESLDAVVLEYESPESLPRPPSTTPFGRHAPQSQTPPDSAKDMQSESESDAFEDSSSTYNEAVAKSRRHPRGHMSSKSRDFIMAIPERPSLMGLKGHRQQNSSISKVWFHNRSSSAPAADLVPATSWNGRILFHHDARPCLKFILVIPQNEQRDYRAAQFRMAGSRGLLDPFKCLSCKRGLRRIFTTGTGPNVYLSYFLWCGRVDACNAVNPDKCLVCPCHTVGTGRLHIGYYDALEQQVVVQCSDCFTTCRDCRMNEAVQASEAQVESSMYHAM